MNHLVVSYSVGLATVGCALVAFYVIARVWKSGGFRVSTRKRLLSIIETAALAQHAVLHVVRIGRRYYALAGASGNVTVICELVAAEVEAESAT